MVVPWWPFVLALLAVLAASFRIRAFRMEDLRFRMERERLHLMKMRQEPSPAVQDRVAALRKWIEAEGLPLEVDDFGRLHARHDPAEDFCF